MSYILLTTPLVLHADPILPSHAVTRRYVDAKRLNVNASWFTTGTISAARMPALGGDVSSVAGSGTVSLNVNGVIAGTYTKVTVDATGRVTAGATLVPGDIASISWTKITSGKPTAAAGYGITNLISLSGGTASGNISSTATPSASLHAVTKGYVDNAISGVVSASLSSGDVIRKPVTFAPAGFLRCNGSNVNKTTFAGLFAVIGETYVIGTSFNSAGKPWQNQWDFNTQQSTNISDWNSSVLTIPTPVYQSQAIVTKNRVYLLGGYNASPSSAVYTAPINADGTLGAWATATSLPVTVYNAQAIVISNRVYILGGDSSSTIFTTAILSDGQLGTWSTAGFLPTTITEAQAIVTKSRVFILGGNTSGGRSNVVYTAPINADGTLGTWSTGFPLPAAIYKSHAVVTSSRVYLIGGETNSAYSSSVYTAPINADGTLGTWASSNSLPATIGLSQTVVTKNRVYLLGGIVNNVNSAVTHTAPINTDGTLGAWTTSSSMNTTSRNSQAIVTNSRIYLLGGIINSPNADVISAPFLGGFNDYTNYSTQITTAITDFTLPDFSSLEESNINYFIKT